MPTRGDEEAKAEVARRATANWRRAQEAWREKVRREHLGPHLRSAGTPSTSRDRTPELPERGQRIAYTYPPYHPELQPIEELWQDVKMHVARRYRGGRTMKDLESQLREVFNLYGTGEHSARKVTRARLAEEVLSKRLNATPAILDDSEDSGDERGRHLDDDDVDPGAFSDEEE